MGAADDDFSLRVGFFNCGQRFIIVKAGGGGNLAHDVVGSRFFDQLDHVLRAHFFTMQSTSSTS